MSSVVGLMLSMTLDGSKVVIMEFIDLWISLLITGLVRVLFVVLLIYNGVFFSDVSRLNVVPT